MGTGRLSFTHGAINARRIEMRTTYRSIRVLLPAILVGGLTLLINVNPLAQSSQLPSPTSHVSDFGGVLDVRTRNRLENLLQSLKERSKIDFYVVTVETTAGQDIFDFSRKLARDWNIGFKNSSAKSLLLVVSAASKSSFTQFSRKVQGELPEGVLGEMTQRMRGPLSEGRFADAVNGAVQLFANALAEKHGFSVADLPAATIDSSEGVVESPQAAPISVSIREKTRPRTVSEVPKVAKTEVPNAEVPTETPPTEEPKAEVPTETPKTEEPKAEVPIETPKTEEPKALARKETPPTKTRATTSNKKPAEPVDDDAESEEVELTLTLPLPQRAVKLKEFLDTHPNSKSRTRASELLISTYAGLGDQHLKMGDSTGGVEQLLRAIDEADVSISDKLFSGVISQIPANLYLRGERTAAFKAAQNIEAKFGTDPKRLLTVAGFYLGIERGDEAIRIAEAAVKLAPDLAEAHRTLALGLHISLRLEEAAAEYKRTLELDPTSKVSRGSLADLYRAGGKAEEALALYDEQLTADPKDRAARAGKVVSLFELGRQAEANTELEAALVDEPRNLPLLTGAAYWLAAHENSERAFDLARNAVVIEPRYTWAQIALVRSLLGLKRPLDAERAMRFARQYGKFPTLNYELANVLATMGLYDEAAEVLRESFVIRDDQIEAQLAGRLTVREMSFLELLAPERRAAIYQATSADSAANARMMKALLAFNVAITQTAEGEKLNEKLAAAAAQEFASGTDSMRAFRQLYAANRLLRNGVGVSTALELVEHARKIADEALSVPVLTMAVQADEFRELRARAIASGNIPDVADAPRSVLENILKGRIEDLTGWALFNQEKYPEAINHLKQAAAILPAGTPSWRSALWHLGVALEQSGQSEQALDYFIRSYNEGERDPIRRSVIERVYREVNGSLNGLDERIGVAALGSIPTATTPASPVGDETSSRPITTAGTTTTPSSIAAAPAASPERTATPEVSPAETPKPEATPSASPESAPPEVTTPPPATPESPQPTSEASLRNAASRLRSTIKITGRILDASKNGIGNVVVVLISPSGAVLASTTDTEGNYTFTVAPSQKTYRVIPSKDGYTFAPIDRTLAGLIEDQREIDFVGSTNRAP